MSRSPFDATRDTVVVLGMAAATFVSLVWPPTLQSQIIVGTVAGAAALSTTVVLTLAAKYRRITLQPRAVLTVLVAVIFWQSLVLGAGFGPGLRRLLTLAVATCLGVLTGVWLAYHDGFRRLRSLG